MSAIKGEGVMTVSNVEFDFEAYSTFIALRVEKHSVSHENVNVLFQPEQWREFLLLVNALPFPEETS